MLGDFYSDATRRGDDGDKIVKGEFCRIEDCQWLFFLRLILLSFGASSRLTRVVLLLMLLIDIIDIIDTNEINDSNDVIEIIPGCAFINVSILCRPSEFACGGYAELRVRGFLRRVCI